MSVKITQTITGVSVVEQREPHKIEHIVSERPTVLSGRTYKIKTPLSEHALYVTINNENGAPFEVFLNSKDMQHYQWIVALTRVISAVFRKGGDCTFLVEELKHTHDPSGGFFSRGRYIPSLVAEIGYVLEDHLIDLGLIVKDESLKLAAQAMIAEKNKEASKQGLPCEKCGEHALIMLDNCLTCTSCGASKCG